VVGVKRGAYETGERVKRAKSNGRKNWGQGDLRRWKGEERMAESTLRLPFPDRGRQKRIARREGPSLNLVCIVWGFEVAYCRTAALNAGARSVWLRRNLGVCFLGAITVKCKGTILIYSITSRRSQWSSSSTLACGARDPRFESRCGQRFVFLRKSLRYAALGTGCTLIAVPRSTQPSTHQRTVNEYQPYG